MKLKCILKASTAWKCSGSVGKAFQSRIVRGKRSCSRLYNWSEVSEGENMASGVVLWQLKLRSRIDSSQLSSSGGILYNFDRPLCSPSSLEQSDGWIDTTTWEYGKQAREKRTLLKEASNLKNGKIHAGNSFVTHDLDPWHFYPKINGFPWLIVEHFCVEFGNPSCVGFWDIVQKNRQVNFIN